MSDGQPIGLSVRLPFKTGEEFLARYGLNVTRGGIYLRSKSLKPPGTPVVLEIKLERGERLLYALAVVAYVTGNKGEGVPGMGFKFITLDGATRRFLDSACAAMPHVRSSDPPVPGGLGPVDASRDAVPPLPPTVAPNQPLPTLPSETSGRLVVQSSASEVQAPPFEPSPEPPREGPIVGIDLGTTNTCVAIVRDGRPMIIKAKDGQSLIPSMVALTGRGKLVAGAAAKGQLTTNPRWTVVGFKRLIGRTYDGPEVRDLVQRFAWDVEPTADGDCGARLGDRVYRLEEISAMVLREAKELAQVRLGRPVHRAVITVPAWYNEKQRLAVREAGRLAGLHVERIVNEPTAAALAYGYGRKLSQRVLVYDLGGGTFDASVLELNDTVYEVMSTGGDNFLGGIDFDNAIVSWLLTEFEQQYDTIFSDRVAIQRVMQAAENAKIALSTATEARISVPFVTMVNGAPVDLSLTLSRAKLVELTRALVDKTMTVCQAVLQAREVRADQIAEILLVGGQSKAPLVQERIAVLFGQRPMAGINPDEAVALGAAQLAHALETKEGLLLIDVLPMSIGIGLPGGRYHPIITRNTALPATRKHVVRTTRDQQTELEYAVFQGEDPLVRQNAYLGTFKVTGLPAGPKGSVSVELTFEVTNESLLNLSAREESTGQEFASTFATKDAPEQVKARLAALEDDIKLPKAGFLGWLKGLFTG